MINVNTLKPGITFQEGQDIFIVISSHHSKQGRGQAIFKVKAKNLRNHSITLKSYVSGEKLEKAIIDKQDMLFLYKDDKKIFLMNEKTFEQIEILIEKAKWEVNFLKEGLKLQIKKFNNEVLSIELPINLEMKVLEAPNAIKGNTQNNPLKKIKLETGFWLEAPMFINENDNIIVSTVDGKYVGRGGK